MKGREVPNMWVIELEPREAACLRFVAKDIRELFREKKFGMTELEDETLERLIEVLRDAPGAAAGAGNGVG